MARDQGLNMAWWLRRVGEPTVIVALGVPLALLVWNILGGDIAADPFPPALRETGQWSGRLLAGGLLLTPLARISRQPGWIRFRRIVGLWAAAYAAAHLALWGLDYGFDWRFLGSEIIGRPYLAIGMVAVIALVPLVLTSFNRAIRFLGGRRWRMLHRLVYLIVPLAIIHWVMALRAPLPGVLFWGGAASLALGWRIWRARTR